MTKNFFGLQSLDKQFDDGFFDYLDNLVNFFAGFIRYSLNRRLDPGFFNSSGGLIRYSLDRQFDDGFFSFSSSSGSYFSSFFSFSSSSGSYFSSFFRYSLNFFGLRMPPDPPLVLQTLRFFQFFQYGSVFFNSSTWYRRFCFAVGGFVLYGIIQPRAMLRTRPSVAMFPPR